MRVRRAKRWSSGRVAACIACTIAAGPQRAHAVDADTALAAFARPAAPRARVAATTAFEWQRRLPDATRMQPTRSPEPDAGRPLVPAARAGRDDAVRALIDRGAVLDSLNDDGFSALGAAAFGGQRSTVRMLLRAGADPRVGSAAGQGALHLAALAGQLDVLREMLRGGVDLELLNAQRESALDVAAVAGRQEAMALLIEAGADSSRAGRR